MNRGTVIIGGFVVIVAGVLGANFLLGNQPPITITLAVDPLAESWVRQAVTDFNAASVVAQGRPVQVQTSVTVEDDFSVWRERPWNSSSHPDAWIPAASVSVGYAASAGQPFVLVRESLAQTPVLLGIRDSRKQALVDDRNQPLDWLETADAAAQETWSALGGDESWGFVDLVLAQPDQSMVGLAPLLSAAASYYSRAKLSGADLNDSALRAWLEPMLLAVGNPTSIGSDAVSFMARNQASGEIGAAPEVFWLRNLAGLNGGDSIRLSYPRYSFVFDFPLAVWDDADITEEQRAAVAAFGDYLLSAPVQESVADYGLRPAAGSVSSGGAQFVDAEAYGVLLVPPYDQIVQPPSESSDILAFLNWVEGVR